MNQFSLKNKVSAEGVSLHHGEQVTVSFLPSDENTGIVFRRVDLPGSPEIKPNYNLVTDLLRNTTVSSGDVEISTIEHVMSALRGMGVDNAVVELDGAEPPIFDGSAKKFVEMVREAEVVEQGAERSYLKLDQTVSLVNEDRILIACPHEGFKVTCTFADDKSRHTQFVSLEITPESYVSDIAEARTFAFYEDIEGLLSQGKIKGGSLDTALVIKDDKVMSKEPLRFENEFVRHKVLDIVGDLALLGSFFQAHIIATKPGHALNVKFAGLLGEHWKI
ncbi:MAG: UDP-3-O-acyl-N-acetylglucosamine deacetylase [Opitutales bacterium]|nr:UDP-3-O-acyl-N-acetylglucosamine deacetylase [Opitutales bacterium]